jgi:hypothetical protein
MNAEFGIGKAELKADTPIDRLKHRIYDNFGMRI